MTAQNERVTIARVKRTFKSEGPQAARALAESKPRLSWLVREIDAGTFDPDHQSQPKKSPVQPAAAAPATSVNRPRKKKKKSKSRKRNGSVDVVQTDSQTGTQLVKLHTKCGKRLFRGYVVRRQDGRRKNYYFPLPEGADETAAAAKFREVAADLARQDQEASLTAKVIPITDGATSKAA